MDEGRYPPPCLPLTTGRRHRYGVERAGELTLDVGVASEPAPEGVSVGELALPLVCYVVA